MLTPKKKARHTKATMLGFVGEIHDHMIMNRFLLINAACESEKVFSKWMDDHLGRKSGE